MPISLFTAPNRRNPHIRNLEAEEPAALTIEAAAMAGVALAGTDWIPGK